ncbi:decarboxylating 6-phosphogluconate dehydrogenase [Haloechinothrix sp. YIM 98757]|uniref:Decarboxylating 6-phosphogluconate dehydrogenase n=2 Tax=Haloechinothrix aidingensis TaxID=2752311 RepID=A0A838AD26_9PSEU|nr:decarboxylating 6-phosphogluconate dehydrogenase [Haloechinothrix aidingensis]MBA0127186.1 decarboxylating 6-phosphogluconate dehydrogenase [Haloechinothrix aidingensis]
MQVGMVGAGRMGANLARRLTRAGHGCVVYDSVPEAVEPLRADGARTASSLAELVAGLATPRVVWLMVPVERTGSVLDEVAGLLDPGDVVIDGGNSYYRDSVARARELGVAGIRFVDVGTSGGVYGLQRGFCLMIGGETVTVRWLDPVFRALAPGGMDGAAGAQSNGQVDGVDTAELGYLHCGPAGAGHFVKMVHNGIEYGQMAALAEGLEILQRAGIGDGATGGGAGVRPDDAEVDGSELDVARIAEVWRRGSVISSWLLDLTAGVLRDDPQLEGFSGHVADSGEGRWTVQTAVEEGVPAYVLTAALYERFSSRRSRGYADRVLSGMRHAFGGHQERQH